MSSPAAGKDRLNTATSKSICSSWHKAASDHAPSVAAASAHGALRAVPTLEGLQHRGRAVDEQADGIAASGGQVAPLEHALVQAGAEQQRRVRGEIAGVETGAEPPPLVGQEERVQLPGYPALRHTPLSGGIVEQLSAFDGEAAEVVRERADHELAGLSRRQDRWKGPARHGPAARWRDRRPGRRRPPCRARRRPPGRLPWSARMTRRLAAAA